LFAAKSGLPSPIYPSRVTAPAQRPRSPAQHFAYPNLLAYTDRADAKLRRVLQPGRCHRTALTRAILGLQDAVSMDVLFYRRDPDRVRAGSTRPHAGMPIKQGYRRTSAGGR